MVGFAPHATPTARAAAERGTGTADVEQLGSARVLRIRSGVSVAQEIRLLRRRPGVRYAVPDYIAHLADGPARSAVAFRGTGPHPDLLAQAAQASPAPPAQASPAPPPEPAPIIPNDPGRGSTPGGWQAVQWNFLPTSGVNAPEAWAHVAAAGAPGGSGVTVAVLDTGVAYENRGRFRRSPDFLSSQFVPGYDFVGHSPHPDDHNGHGTHVAGTIAEATNNGYGLTGLAFGAKIMPVRVLNSHGEGDARNIAAGVLWAVRHGAKVINLSLEFSEDVTARQIPELITAIAYAHRKGVFVTGASGNEGHATIAYPARARGVIAVGATTEHGCLADFSNDGRGLDLVAPGGGSDANLTGDGDCHPVGPTGRDVYQVTFTGQNPRKFGLPSGYEGTSMAAPHVAATAALVIASRVLGPNPTPDGIAQRLEATARHLGPAGYNPQFGWGLIDAAAATDPTVPVATTPLTTPPR